MTRDPAFPPHSEYLLLSIEAHITNDTSQNLLHYHESICMAGLASFGNIASSDMEVAENVYRCAVERFHSCPTIEVLQGLEQDGTGELLEG